MKNFSRVSPPGGHSLKIICEPGAEVALIGLEEDAKVEPVARQADLVFRGTVIGADEIELEACSGICRSLPAPEQVHVQKNGDLNPRQAPSIDVPDSPHEVEPLVAPAQT